MSKKEFIEMIPVMSVRMEAELQMRAEEIDSGFVEHLTEILREDKKAELEPIVVFEDGLEETYLIGDGNHRRAAYQLAEREMIPVIKMSGGREACFRYALGANADQNAKPRTRKDLRRAVEAAVKRYYFDPENSDFMHCIKLLSKERRMNQQEIAEICKCNQSSVQRIIKSLEGAVKPAGNGSAPAVQTKASAAGQMDFWARLNEDYAPVHDALETLRRHPLWAIPEWDRAEKIECIGKIKDNLKREIEELTRVESALKEGAA